jgi:hypothetical protein
MEMSLPRCRGRPRVPIDRSGEIAPAALAAPASVAAGRAQAVARRQVAATPAAVTPRPARPPTEAKRDVRDLDRPGPGRAGPAARVPRRLIAEIDPFAGVSPRERAATPSHHGPAPRAPNGGASASDPWTPVGPSSASSRRNAAIGPTGRLRGKDAGRGAAVAGVEAGVLLRSTDLARIGADSEAPAAADQPDRVEAGPLDRGTQAVGAAPASARGCARLIVPETGVNREAAGRPGGDPRLPDQTPPTGAARMPTTGAARMPTTRAARKSATPAARPSAPVGHARPPATRGARARGDAARNTVTNARTRVLPARGTGAHGRRSSVLDRGRSAPGGRPDGARHSAPTRRALARFRLPAVPRRSLRTKRSSPAAGRSKRPLRHADPPSVCS